VDQAYGCWSERVEPLSWCYERLKVVITIGHAGASEQNKG
jgi:hypothetical protein